jgi:hypothetical protein
MATNTVLHKCINTSSDDRYCHRFTRLPHLTSGEYTKRKWGQILTSNLILVCTYQTQTEATPARRNSYRSAQFTHLHPGITIRMLGAVHVYSLCEMFIYYTKLYENLNGHTAIQEPLSSRFHRNPSLNTRKDGHTQFPCACSVHALHANTA